MNLNVAIDFLKELSLNNNKPWMDEHRAYYEEAKRIVTDFTAEILAGFAENDPAFSLIQPKDCLFRINRDVRFSKDKSPYKTNFGVNLNPFGKKSPKAGYYIHLADNNSFLGGGIWMPDKEVLKKIRQEIDYNWDEFQEIIGEKMFKKYFHFDGEKLKRPPKGYEVDNPAVEYLKFKSFTVLKPLSNNELSSEIIKSESLEHFNYIHKFIHFLNRTFD
ncbi:MAG TPA: DUF2461 domain-containing protein [Edaphocola sp.]|nr:DUF2461 domain-containing protein [Edaphocola sp.]